MKPLILSLLGITLMIGLAACSGEKDEWEEEIPVSLRIGFLSQTKVVAHRGYWDTKGSAENSLAALQKAAEAGFYGSEFDVRFTLDGVPVICHDEKINEVMIETAYYDRIKNIKLSNGETLPTLQQYLRRGKELDIQLILELKVNKSSEKDLKYAATIVSMVKEMGMEEQVEYISFSVPVCREFIRLSPQSSVSFLGGYIPPSELKKQGFTGMDYLCDVLREKPEWIREAKELGLTVNVWIVNDLLMMYDFILKEVDFITTDRPAHLKQMLGHP
ncbi:MAG: glycerophosphodiester phosphodiesterase [Tannerellaceae bacterium]|jgi:glycerophosphoryl diester phosphodiesterase|nr:glycerophosphodiester phosphodiesterase [Tannerellaceae bacterium]